MTTHDSSVSEKPRPDENLRAAGDLPAPRGATSMPDCDSCGRPSATHVVPWPDARHRVCTSCIPRELLAVVEPLDDDDDLATDPMDAVERARERGNLA